MALSEVCILQMSDPHNHHFVPQFYQRGFSVPGDSHKVWVYERGIKPRRRSVRSTGMEIDLYAIQDSQGITDFATVERELGLLDNHAARLIQRIEKRDRITQKDRRLLCRFVSVMWRRTPKHKAKVKELAKKYMPQVFEPIEQLEFLTPETREELKQIRQRYSENPPSFLFPQHVLRQSEFEEVMYGMDWGFFEAQNSEFLTSDDPVMFSKGSGLGSADAVIGFPLSKKLFVQCMWKSVYQNGFHVLPRENVEYFNSSTIKSAHKRVYASLNSPAIQVAVDNELGTWE
jgi:hypothetical protein